MKKNSKGHAAKLFNETKAYPPTDHALLFLWIERIQPGSDVELIEHPGPFSLCLHQYILIGSKTNHPVHNMEFGLVTSDGDIMLLFLPRDLTVNTVVFIKCLGRVLPWIERMAFERPYTCQKASSPSHTNKKNSILAARKFQRAHCSLYLSP